MTRSLVGAVAAVIGVAAAFTEEPPTSAVGRFMPAVDTASRDAATPVARSRARRSGAESGGEPLTAPQPVRRQREHTDIIITVITAAAIATRTAIRSVRNSIHIE